MAVRADVVVVGGGPVGCYSGLLLARSGFSVVVMEEHLEVGNPACCAGVVGVRGLKKMGVSYSPHVLSKLRRAIVHSPSGHSVEIGRGRVEAVVINRAGFDRTISEDAEAAGARLITGARCVGLKIGKTVRAEFRGKCSGSVEADLVLGADGAASRVARMAEISKKRSYILCAQTELKGQCEEDAAEIFLGRKYARGFFGWMVNAGGRCRIGTGTLEGSPLTSLQNLVRMNPALRGRVRGKIVPCARPIPNFFIRKPFGRKVMLVGDAAGQVKPLTGGGIWMGLRCAHIAAGVAAEYLRDGRTDLSEYGKAVDKIFGREIYLGQIARRIFRGMSDDDLDKAVRLLDGGMKKIVCENFDFDHHGRLISALMKKIPDVVAEVGLRGALIGASAFFKGK
ncbi:MAG: NAD(P)/FAD-dependent oxidoreductase [Candidatus Hadarchaeales archaeon]